MAKAATVLIIPGLGGSGPEHWQSRWEQERGDCRRIDQRDYDDPQPEDWLANIDRAYASTTGPVVLVAHSLGCIALANWAGRSDPEHLKRAAALFVAPCDPEQENACVPIRRFLPLHRGALPFRSILIASSDDPFARLERNFAFARSWGSLFVDAGPLGHINAASKLGDWTYGQGILEQLVKHDAAAHRCDPQGAPPQ